MAELVLHHFQTSPFSEKVRRVLAYKRIDYLAVEIPPIAPKPDYVALTGGYRRTPSLQIGADIYCDTALICEVLDSMRPLPPLIPKEHAQVTRIWAQWAESSLFWAALAYSMLPSGIADVFKGLPEQALEAFRADRMAMSTNMTRLEPPDGAAAYRIYLERLSGALSAGQYVCGPNPTLADFACYHPLWYTRTRTPSLSGILDAFPHVLAWMDRMAGLGSSAISRISAKAALEIAALAEPSALDGQTAENADLAPPLGAQVSVRAESFGPEQTVGELIGLRSNRITLRRHDQRAGWLHVHFPRLGYALKRA